MIRLLILILIMIPCFYGCKDKNSVTEDAFLWQPLEVTASAYNSVPSQTANHPNLAAWGDTLRPGMKCIAVSRDLIGKGLKHNTPVKIEGLEGIYLVKDKMHYRWRNKIDIYMGNNIREAREWGRKKLTIFYGIPKKEGDLR